MVPRGDTRKGTVTLASDTGRGHVEHRVLSASAFTTAFSEQPCLIRSA